MKKALLLLPLFLFSYVYPSHSTPKPDIIVFDFGGVVGFTDYDVFTQKIQEKLNVSYSKAKSMVKKAKKTDGEYWETYTIKYGQYLPFDLPEEAQQLKRESIRMDPEIEKIIKDLKKHGCKVAMLSNVTKVRAKSIRDLGLYEPFNPVLLSCEIDTKKPHKKAYKLLLKKLGNVRPERCLFVDDKQKNIDAAARVGIQGVRFQSPKKLRSELVKLKILPSKK